MKKKLLSVGVLTLILMLALASGSFAVDSGNSDLIEIEKAKASRSLYDWKKYNSVKAWKAIDPYDATLWEVDGIGQWLKVDLGEVHSIDAIDLTFLSGSKKNWNFKAATEFELQVSRNGFSWTTVYYGRKGSGTVKFLPVEARHLKIKGFGKPSWKLASWGIADVDVHAGKVSEYSTAEKVAERINYVNQPKESESKLRLPRVPEGYEVSIAKSSNPDLINQKGEVTHPEGKKAKNVKLSFEVRNTSTGKVATTDALKVKVNPELTRSERLEIVKESLKPKVEVGGWFRPIPYAGLDNVEVHDPAKLTYDIRPTWVPRWPSYQEVYKKYNISARTLREWQIEGLNLLKERQISSFTDKKVDDEKVKHLIETMNPDGSWPQINYNKPPVRAQSSNVKYLVRAFMKPESEYYQDNQLKKAIHKSLQFGLKHQFSHRNWWYQIIGNNRAYSKALLAFKSYLTQSEREKAIAMLRKSQEQPLSGTTRSGANQMWTSDVMARRGMISEEPRPRVVREAYARVAREVNLSPHTAIQPDYSFYAHGAIPYNHGYGAKYLKNFANAASKASGTGYGFNEKTLEILANTFLKGNRWMLYGKYEDFSAAGRELNRPGDVTPGYIEETVSRLLELNLPEKQKEELENYLEAFKKGKKGLVTGNRDFWRSDYMVHKRKDYHTSVRMYSTDTQNTDAATNQEGVKMHHLADGTTYIMRTGREYVNIPPVWDWQKIPGTTVVQKPEMGPIPKGDGGRYLVIFGNTEFVGSVSDGTYGLSAFDFKNPDNKWYEDLSAHKSWFFFDEGFVALGAGISSTSGYPVETTINQSLLSNGYPARVVVNQDGEEKELDEGEHELQDVSWVYHNKIAYTFPSPEEVELGNTVQKGSWSEIDKGSDRTETISKEVFSLGLDHGTEPKNTKYSYKVLPEISTSEIEEVSSELEIVKNTKSVQAVRDTSKNLSQVAFYEAKSLDLGNELTVEVSQPSLVMIDDQDSKMEIAVSDPTQNLDSLEVKVNVHLKGKNVDWNEEKGFSEISFDLPEEEYAGSNVVRSYTVVS